MTCAASSPSKSTKSMVRRPVNAVGSGCVTGYRHVWFEQCGFRNGIDTNAIEVKQLYVDFRMPQSRSAIAHNWAACRSTSPRSIVRSLYTMDAGGGQTRLTFTDQVSLLFYYVQLEEDIDRFPGSTKIGEDYLTGSTLMLKPINGLDFHPLGVYVHGQAPFGPALTGRNGPFNNIASDSRNVTTESRYYLGFDSRYRIGNTSIEPTFIYLLGTRNFRRPARPSPASRIPTTMPFRPLSPSSIRLGPWLFGGKLAMSRATMRTTTSIIPAWQSLRCEGLSDYGDRQRALLRRVVRDPRQVGCRRQLDPDLSPHGGGGQAGSLWLDR